MSTPKYDSRGLPYTEEATLTRESEAVKAFALTYVPERDRSAVGELLDDRLAAIEAAVRADEHATPLAGHAFQPEAAPGEPTPCPKCGSTCGHIIEIAP